MVLAIFAIQRSGAAPGGTGPELSGAIIQGSPEAPDFSLIDQNGATVRMRDLRGKVVTLTFLYTRCPDACPIIANKLASSVERLGPLAKDVQMLAVTVDPTNDTRLAITNFTDGHGLGSDPNWHYLIGPPSQLQPVWRAYGVGTSASQSGQPSTDLVDHSAMVYLIDRQGKLRSILDVTFRLEDFLQDVRALA